MDHNADRSAIAGAVRREQFEALYAEHHTHLSRYVLRRTDDSDDAADVVAEAFLVVWRRLDDAPAENVRPWLYGVARRVLANHRRGERRRHQLAAELQSDLATRGAAPAGREMFGELAAAFRSLSDGDREILALEGWEQLDPGEIGTVLGCSRNAARIRLHRARRRLRAAVAASRSPTRQPLRHIRGDIS
ncbi:MAG: sigma-70 family RNA polymerase sigma factor [Actinomycetota bacterium]|nr:sigma-70 family RNA polymerase sigma factor [Actinomycetota bacterium]